MRFAVHHPVLFPWPGLYHKASVVDVLVLLDEVQFPRGFNWINHNRIKSPQGVEWLVAPVLRKGMGLAKINEVRCLSERRWPYKQTETIRHCYSLSPFFDEHFAFIKRIYSNIPNKLLDFNLQTIDYGFRIFGLRKNWLLLSDLNVKGGGSKLIVSIAKALNADTFVAPAAGKRHYDTHLMEDSGLKIRWLRFNSPIYPQLWGNFKKDLSYLDIIFNYGPYAWNIVKSFQKDNGIA